MKKKETYFQRKCREERKELHELMNDFIDQLVLYKNGSICNWKLQILMNYMNEASDHLTKDEDFGPHLVMEDE